MLFSPNKELIPETETLNPDTLVLLSLINSITNSNTKNSTSHNDLQRKQLPIRKQDYRCHLYEPLIPPTSQWSGQEGPSLSLDMLSQATGPDITALNMPTNCFDESYLNLSLDQTASFQSDSTSPALPSTCMSPGSLPLQNFPDTEMTPSLNFNDLQSTWPWLESPVIHDVSSNYSPDSTLLNSLEQQMNDDFINSIYSPNSSSDARFLTPSLCHQASPTQFAYPTPHMPQPQSLESFLANVDPEILASVLPSPDATPATVLATPCLSDILSPEHTLASSSTRTPFMDSLLSFDGANAVEKQFDLFPSLDDVMASSPILSGGSPSLSAQATPVNPSTDLLDNLHQYVQQVDSDNKISQSQVAALLLALGELLDSSKTPSIAKISATKSNDVSALISGDKIVKRRRVTKMYSCDHPGCDRAFTRHFNLKAHKKTHDPNRERPFVCEICDKRFIRAHDLMRHQPVHTKVKEFECDHCLKRFSRKDAKDRHMLLGKCK